LEKWIEKRYSNSHPTELVAWNIFYQLAEGLSLIHCGTPSTSLVPETYWEPITHGDIHESNILVQNNNIDGDESCFPNFKLANFGKYMTVGLLTLSDKQFKDIRDLGDLMTRLCTYPRGTSHPPEYSEAFMDVISGANPPKHTLPSSAVMVVQKIRRYFEFTTENELWSGLGIEEEEFKRVARVIIPNFAGLN
jgi:serine/threonine protein kinase